LCFGETLHSFFVQFEIWDNFPTFISHFVKLYCFVVGIVCIFSVMESPGVSWVCCWLTLWFSMRRNCFYAKQSASG
jgi:hypothetical protein